MKRKAEFDFFKNRKERVHIAVDGFFYYNGFIIQTLERTFVLKDDVIGEKLFFYSDVYKLEKFISKRKNG